MTQFDRMERRLDEIAASLEEIAALLRGRRENADLWAAARGPEITWCEHQPGPVPLRKLGEHVVIPFKDDK